MRTDALEDSGIRIRLAGEWSVTVDRRRLDDGVWPGRQGRLLLAYLACHRDEPVPRAELAELLWPDGPPRSWTTALAVLISKVRTALSDAGIPGPVDGRGGCYRLHPAVWVDVEAADRAVTAAEAAAAAVEPARARELAESAIDTAAEEFLPGIDNDWVDAMRRAMRTVLLRGLRIHLQACLAVDDPQAAVGTAERLLAEDPLEEAAYRGLIRAWSALGERGAALRAYERCRTVLDEDLGTTPSPETESAFLAALRAGSSPVRDRLPPMPLDREPTPFVGRQAPLTVLRSVLDEALRAGGRGLPVVLVTGEPGIGKTRLLQEFAGAADRLGAAVLFGRCQEEQTAPYLPFVEAMTHLARAWSEELAGLWPPVLGRLVGRREYAGSSARPDEAAILPAPADRDQRFALFDAVRSTLAALSRQAPVVLMIDDAQWADGSTVRLLRHLVGADGAGAVGVVIAYRDNEVGERHPLAAVLAELDRLERVTRLPLAPLTPAEVAVLLADRRDLVTEVHRLTAGNPFFLRHLIRHLDEYEPGSHPGQRLPAELTAVVAGRLTRLRRGATATLEVAAVAGSRFSIPVLAAATGRGQDNVLRDLEDAVAHRLVDEDPTGPDAFTFTHDLVRQALYQRLSASRRARTHRSVATALESQPGTPVAELARHFQAAAIVDPALRAPAARYADLAGRAAEARLAHELAAGHFAAALAIDEHPPRKRAELTLALARVRGVLGDPAAAATYLQAAAHARTAGDAGLLADAALGLAGTWARSGEIHDARIALLREALTALGPTPSARRARLLARLAGEGYWTADHGASAALAGEAVTVARTVGDPGAIAQSLEVSTYLRWGPGEAEDRLTAAREMVAWARRAGDPEAELQGHGWGITAAAQLCAGRELNAQLAAYTSLAQRLRQPRYRWYALTRRAMRAIMIGDYAGGGRLMAAAQAIATRTEQADADFVRYSVFAPLWLERRDLTAARATEAFSADTDAAFGAESSAAHSIRCAAIALDLACGQTDAAAHLLQHFTPDRIARLPPDYVCAFTLATLAWASIGTGDDTRAAAVSDRLRPLAGYAAVWAGAVSFWGSLAHWLGALAVAREELDEAQHWLTVALPAHQRVGARPWIARTLLEQARLALLRGQQLTAQILLRRASALATEIGARALAAEIAGMQPAGH